MKPNKYAAIAIPTLNRYEHLLRCIESLKKSNYSQKTDLYIALDQAPSDKYVSGRKQIEKYLDEGITGFANVYVYKHESNLGPIKNMDFVLEWVSHAHERYIFTEDDNEFSSNYLEYINRLLDIYEKDNSVVAISGYNYPIRFNEINEEIYSSNVYFAAFGFAGWFNRYYSMRREMTLGWIYDMFGNSQLLRKLRQFSPNQYCNFIKGMLGYTALLENDDGVWKMDLTYGLYMFSHDKKMIFPIISKVRNWGYDGSGINCNEMDYNPKMPVTHRNFGFECQILDARSECSDIKLVSESENEAILDRVNEFFDVPTVEVLKCHIAYMASRIVGIDTMRKIWKK